jgi:hypothetical protein
VMEIIKKDDQNVVVAEQEQNQAMVADQEVLAAESNNEIVEHEVQPEDQKPIEKIQVMIHPVPVAVSAQFEVMLAELREMQQEIEEKERLAHEKNNSIAQRIHVLIDTYKVEINKSHYEHFVRSIATYMQLLRDMHREFVEEIVLCSFVKNVQAPMLYDLPINTELETYKWFLGHDALTEVEKERLVLGKIQHVKRYIKTVKKDLRVSFSRYLFGFDAQMKQVERIEMSIQDMIYRMARQQREEEKQVIETAVQISNVGEQQSMSNQE